ncbi:unnamed protein product [Calypogeia fissa]
MTSRMSFLAGALLTFLCVLGTAMAAPGSPKPRSAATPKLEVLSGIQQKTEIILLNEPGLQDGIHNMFDDKTKYTHPPNEPEMIMPAKSGTIKIYTIGHVDIFAYTSKDKNIGIPEDLVYSALHEIIKDMVQVKEGTISWGGYKYYVDSGVVIGMALPNTYQRLNDAQLAQAIVEKRRRAEVGYGSDSSSSHGSKGQKTRA